MHAVSDGARAARFFIDAPGGTGTALSASYLSGKTFLCNLLLASVRIRGEIALAVASSGIAALLLEGGRTAHSRFKLPIDINEMSVCNVRKQSALARLIRETSLFIWDEAPMAHRLLFQAFDRMLKDLMDSDLPFGGKTVVMCGDFRQVLPIVYRGTRTDTVQASIKRSPLWTDVVTMKLTINMRARSVLNPEEGLRHAEWLLSVGEGRANDENSNVNLPECMTVRESASDLRDLIDRVFPDLAHHFNNIDYITNRAILAPTNDSVDVLNRLIVETMLPGECKTYVSADKIHDTDDCTLTHNLPTEFLNTLTPNGCPPHLLSLKVGATVMLLRNLNAAEGLCNGSRMIIREMHERFLLCELITGQFAGKSVFIPRITIIPTDKSLPFQLSRRQFPVRVAYAMTINKSQGQTVSNVGIYLDSPVFSHGQLYVALSRARSQHQIHVLARDSKHGSATLLRNVVYPEALQ